MIFGDLRIYSKETHENRRAILEIILKGLGYSSEIIYNEPVFWTELKNLVKSIPYKSILINTSHSKKLKTAPLSKI